LVPFVLGSAYVFTLDAGWGPVPSPPDWPLVPVLTFLAGSLTCLFRDFFPANRTVIVVAATVLAAVAGSGFAASLVHVPLAVLLIMGSLFLPLTGKGTQPDLSFGLYIYGWPVQQILAAAELPAYMPPLAFAAAALAATAPLAWLSWRVIESPAQHWNRARMSPSNKVGLA
jgi:peptidoglycan/LPS O-acetylase OafA/YrhL